MIKAEKAIVRRTEIRWLEDGYKWAGADFTNGELVEFYVDGECRHCFNPDGFVEFAEAMRKVINETRTV